jgi:hypothetical protein
MDGNRARRYIVTRILRRRAQVQQIQRNARHPEIGPQPSNHALLLTNAMYFGSNVRTACARCIFG